LAYSFPLVAFLPPFPPNSTQLHQVIGNKYEVYVEYLKNDYKEGYVSTEDGY
jgi:hypothetical protein